MQKRTNALVSAGGAFGVSPRVHRAAAPDDVVLNARAWEPKLIRPVSQTPGS